LRLRQLIDAPLEKLLIGPQVCYLVAPRRICA
jgi:hypothetical protein